MNSTNTSNNSNIDTYYYDFINALQNFDDAMTYVTRVILVPIICIPGFFLNIFCCFVFMTANFRSLRMYQLLFWVTFFHGLGVFIEAFLIIIELSPIDLTKVAVVYKTEIRTWIYNAVTMAGLLCNIAVSFERYILISKKCECFCSKMPVLVFVVIAFLFSLACFSFTMFAFYFVEYEYPDGHVVYYVDYTSFGYSYGLQDTRFAMYTLRDIVLWIVFIVINILLLYATRSHLRKKMTLTGQGRRILIAAETPGTGTTNQQAQRMAKKQMSDAEKAEMRVTLMVVLTSVVLIFGQLTSALYGVGQILTVYLRPDSHYLIRVFYIINNFAVIFSNLTFSFLILVFYFFDRNFEAYVKSLFSRRGDQRHQHRS